MASDLERYAEGIVNTGFPLEHWAATQLQQAGWSIINNKYYIDTDEEKPRELDILAYKATSLPDFDLRTTVFVSCKKVDSRAWAFLRRPFKQDPNSNFEPYHGWTDSPALGFYTARSDWEADYYDAMRKDKLTMLAGKPKHEVFAYQEMYSTTWAPSNKKERENLGMPAGDAGIRASVLSLLKAQAYELETRKKHAKPRVYQFNIMALADTEFVALDFADTGEITASRVSEHMGVARYVINKKDVFSRVYFTTKDSFAAYLGHFEALDRFNKHFFSRKLKEFYDDILGAPDRRQVLADEFSRNAGRALQLALLHHHSKYLPAPSCGAARRPDGKVEVSVSWKDRPWQPDFESDKVRSAVADVLKSVYRYVGDFEISDDIPF